ncbi:hypothetical protein LEP1GSC188_1532 [Leptospira weilii serovar Topaz str. LT2116]|uniref:Uncharacterized protein n=1 Tax=Leptospira weilii serovar Topaz str. LT2116 TaxID=1088540 RepID=M3GS53_9LEPT|nr:hypothetical protein LEP1GSC188_1532 [Leptospira weilii serovar Topaz str. LT2116]
MKRFLSRNFRSWVFILLIFGDVCFQDFPRAIFIPDFCFFLDSLGSFRSSFALLYFSLK